MIIPELPERPCVLCETRVDADHESTPLLSPAGNPGTAHRVCAMREVFGGIGHLVDHDYWCHEMNDPDGGLTYRESALRVAEWLKEHGRPV